MFSEGEQTRSNEAGTPRERHQASAWEAILEAVLGILVNRGGEGLSMRAMAARAAFSRFSLYANFSGKEEILAALAT
jgi:AcrR family transcriptional regulator